MTSAEAKELIPPFLAFAKTLDGDEKSEAQIFLDQLFFYWSHIVPKRPPYAILCVFGCR